MTSISVIMPTRNGERFIATALESVCAQNDPNLDVVVVNDGSTDRTADIAHEFAQYLPIRVITPPTFGNWVAATNFGLRAATGEWVCFLHDDDLWLPGRIARLRPELAQATGSLVLHNAMFVGPDGRALGPWTCPLDSGDVPSDRVMERLLVQNFIAIVSPMFRREPVVETGYLDEALWYTADWDLWLRLAAMGPVRFVAETLSAFRIHPASQTMSRKLAPNEMRQQLMTVLDRHLPRWAGIGRRRRAVTRAALASVSVNSLLAHAWRGEPLDGPGVLVELLALGPWGWRRYAHYSRIVQRVASRLRLRRCRRKTARHGSC